MMEQLHNQIAGLIVHSISKNKIRISDVVLVLEIIKQDLVKQIADQVYKKQPVQISTKKPTKLESKHGIYKDNS